MVSEKQPNFVKIDLLAALFWTLKYNAKAGKACIYWRYLKKYQCDSLVRMAILMVCCVSI